MLFLLIKKSFFDAWDNLGALIMSNLAITTVLMAGLWPMLRILEAGRIAGFLILLMLIPLVAVALGVVSALMSSIADYRRAAWSEIPSALKTAWKSSLGVAGILAGFFTLSSLGISYYRAFENIPALLAAAFLFWMSLAVYLSALWFFAVRNRLSGGFFRSLKKCALIALDNPAVTLFSGIVVVPIQMILWPVTAFAAFGPAGVQLFMNDALRLLMFKYDWLEENPGTGRKNIPWDELLLDERERVGKRTLKGMIFPWKE